MDFEKYVVMRVKEMILFMGDPGKQLLYGTDWPLVSMGPYLRFFEDLDLDDEAKENVAWKTAGRLFRIDTDLLLRRKAERPPEGEAG